MNLKYNSQYSIQAGGGVYSGHYTEKKKIEKIREFSEKKI